MGREDSSAAASLAAASELRLLVFFFFFFFFSWPLPLLLLSVLGESTTPGGGTGLRERAVSSSSQIAPPGAGLADRARGRCTGAS